MRRRLSNTALTASLQFRTKRWNWSSSSSTIVRHLEYDPMDLKKLLIPLRAGDADVVLGSRFLSSDIRRVLYFWHSLGNRFLTMLSNMLTDLNLSDMETCYKVFRREIIQS